MSSKNAITGLCLRKISRKPREEPLILGRGNKLGARIGAVYWNYLLLVNTQIFGKFP